MKNPAHPGEILFEDYLKPSLITLTKASEMLGVEKNSLSDVIDTKLPFTADLAVRVAIFTNTSAKMWMDLQNSFDLAQLDMSMYESIKQYQAN